MIPGLAPTDAGISLREGHMAQLLQRREPLPFVEILADNFMALRGPHYHLLRQVAERYPVILHCVGLSLASSGPDEGYLQRLRIMADELGAIGVSDHLAVCRLPDGHVHDLLPVSYSIDTLDRLCQQVERVQQVTGLPMAVENISRYLAYRDDSLDEGEMLSEMHRRTGAGVLLDVNNLYVTARNLDQDPLTLLESFPLEAVHYCHLAGYEQRNRLLVDTHGSRVSSPVWRLYGQVLERMGPRPMVIEWDNAIPQLPVLLEEAARAATMMQGRVA